MIKIFVLQARHKTIRLLVLWLLPALCLAQQPDSSQIDASKVSEKTLHALNRQYAGMNADIQSSTQKALESMQRREQRLEKKLAHSDSVLAKQLFATSSESYRQLLSSVEKGAAISASASTYVSRLDSMQTALQFLNKPGVLSSLPATKLEQLQALTTQVQQLQANWQKAAAARQFISQREQLLQQKIGSVLPANALAGINKQAWYYQAQLAEYKSALNDPGKMGQKLLSVVREVPAFQGYWQRYSLLAQLFPEPAGYGTAAALNGLQARSAIQQLLQGAGGPGGNPDFAAQQADMAQSSLDKLKDKVASLGGTSGTGDMTLPNFTPDQQHGKALWRRLEYGFDVQNSGSTGWLPVTSTLGLSLGYKFSDKAVAGIGGSYLLGLGSGLSDIHLSNQGVGIRTYVDIRFKGSWWMAGGLEDTWYQAFTHLADIPSVRDWQQSVLTGVMKKWPIGKRSANMQLLYDWLASRQTPRGQALKFRIAYTF